MNVILVFVKDYNLDGEYQIWNVYSSDTSNKQIEEDIQNAKNKGIVGEEAEYFFESWKVLNSI